MHTKSDHLPNFIKHIPASIDNRLFSTEILLKEPTKQYTDNLRQSGHNNKLAYKPTDTNHQKYNIRPNA